MGNDSKSKPDPSIFKDQNKALNVIRRRQGLKPVDSAIDAVRGRSAAKARKERKEKEEG